MDIWVVSCNHCFDAELQINGIMQYIGSIQWYGYDKSYLIFLLLMGIRVDANFWLLWIKMLQNSCTNLYEHIYTLLWCIYIGMKLIGYSIRRSFVSLKVINEFWRVTVLLTFLVEYVRVSVVPHVPQDLGYCQPFIFSHCGCMCSGI